MNEKLSVGVVDGDNFTGDSLIGALHILLHELLPPPPSPLAPIKSRMATLSRDLSRKNTKPAVKIAASRNEAAICAKPAVNLSARRLMGVVARDMQNKQGDIYCSGLGFKTSGRVLSS